MTDQHVYAVAQFLLDHVEWLPAAWRAFLVMAVFSATVTGVSAVYRDNFLPPRWARFILAFEPFVLGFWRLVAALFARLAGVSLSEPNGRNL